MAQGKHHEQLNKILAREVKTGFEERTGVS